MSDRSRHPRRSAHGLAVAAVYDRRDMRASLSAADGHRPPLQGADGHRPPLQAADGHRPPLQADLSKAGFTFVEVLAALLFLAIVVPAIVAALTVANRAAVMSERHAIAGQYAENKLTELVVDNNWANASSTSGDFGAGATGYRWQVTTGNWAGDSVNQMTELDVDVFYTVQGREYKVHVSTLVSQPTTTSTGSGTSS